MFRLIKADIIRRHIESSIKAVLNTQISKCTTKIYDEFFQKIVYKVRHKTL
jgi:hypothetical protein